MSEAINNVQNKHTFQTQLPVPDASAVPGSGTVGGAAGVQAGTASGTAVDGVDGTSNGKTATQKSAAPPLPDVSGPVTVSDVPSAVKSWSSQHPQISLAEALNLLTDLISETQQQVGISQSQQSKIAANEAFGSADAKKEEVQGERKHATNALIGSVVAFAAAAGFAGVGGGMQFKQDGAFKTGAGAALSASGNALSQVINNLVDCIDQNAKSGGSYQAGQAKIQDAIHTALGQVAQGLAQGQGQSYQTWQKAVGDLIALKAAIRDSKNQTNINLAQNA